MYYESLKHSGKYPVIGVNTFLSREGSPTIRPKEVIRATEDEKEQQIKTLKLLHQSMDSNSQQQLQKLKQKALKGENLFDELMETSKYCSLGQITHALYEVGGQYRRNM